MPPTVISARFPGIGCASSAREKILRIDGTVLVTGASQGIGLRVVLELAKRGADVVAGVLDEAAGRRVRDIVGDSVDVRVLDVTSPGVFELPETLGVLVNNAGVRPSNLPVEHQPMSDWTHTFAVNLFGTVEMCRRAIPLLRARGGGTICNIGSTSLFEPTPFLAPYRASKAALGALNEALRLELAPFNIRVLEITPRATQTPMNEESFTRRLVPAAEHPEYAALARRLYATATASRSEPTAVEKAAVAIVDAIESGGSVLRYGTDEISQARLDRWRSSSDEEIMADVVLRLAGADGSSPKDTARSEAHG
jgi:NAD(P)-dependent dehydrogenase (short-subunit alcohol dehydrogenase family)